MIVLGQAALLVAVIVSAWSFLASVIAGVTGSAGMTRSAARGLVASLALLLIASFGLVYAIFVNDFSLEYVADYSSRSQPAPYKVSALWAGQGGSLMFWALLLAAYGAGVVALSRRVQRDLAPWVYAVLSATLLFFTIVTVAAANPFRPLPAGEAPPDGLGMNPLLQNFWMLIHPPTLYIGYVGCVVPFAFGMAALLSGRLDQSWVRSIRRWSLFAFAFLTLGIWLGGYWAYIELGWGGFWAWDPVENASFMPWLVLTAFVHSVIAQDRRGMLKIWNLALIIVTFLLSIYGTFLTRSGIIQSVHAFAKSSIGNWFVGFLAIAGLVSIVALARRLKALRPDSRIESMVSRESVFVLGNLVLLGLTIIVFFLTMYPVFTQLVSGQQTTLEPIQFTRATRPWFLLLVLLMAISPLVAWRQTPGRTLARSALGPAALAIVVTVALALLGAREPWSLLCFATAVFAVAVIVLDAARLLRAWRTNDSAGASFVRFVAAHRRRLGGYLAHISVALMLVGIAASMAYQKTATFESLTPGARVEIDGYKIEYQGYDLVNRPEFDGAQVRLAITRPGASAPQLVRPERRVYGRTRQPSTEVAILSTALPGSFGELRRLGEDLYVIPASVDLNSNQATVEVIVHPMINWLWVGGVLLLLGTVISLWPEGRAPSEAAIPLPVAAADAAS